MNQLDLFATTAPAPPHHAYADTVRAIVGRRFEDFALWCRTGNRSMCAAVLWRTGRMTRQQASDAVAKLAEVMP